MAHNSEAIRLAEASDWVGLERLIEKAPELACVHGDYGMLPIHWACTEAHVPVALLDKLLVAYPDGARAKNAASYLPLHIAIRAQVHPQWLRRLLAVNPQAVHVDTPEELSVLELAEQVGLSKEAMKVLLDAFVEFAPEQQHRDSDDDDDLSDTDEPSYNGDDAHKENNKMTSTASPERAYPDHSQYELLHTTPVKKRSSLSPGRRHHHGSERYQLLPNQEGDESDDHRDDDDHNQQQQQMWPPLIHGISRLTSTDTSDAVGSPHRRSLSSLSDDGTLDSPHDGNLISPSSTSTSSQAHSTSSVNSAPLPLTVPSLHKQLPGPFHRKHSLDYHRAAVAAAAAQAHQESLIKRCRNQPQSRSAASAGQLGGRHQSLPVIPSFENYKFAPMTLNPSHFNSQHPHDTYHDRSSEEDESEHARRRFNRTGPSGTEGGFRNHSGADVDDDELNQHHLHHGRHFESPPEWKRDDECSICRVSFGMFKHRHHCRNCGKSICSQHSADRKVSMASKGFKTPQRVCVTCYADLTNQSRPKQHEMSPFDAVLDAAGLGSSNNPVVAFAMQHMHMQAHQQQQQQQQHYAMGTQSLRSPQYTSPLTNNNNGGSPTETFVSTNGSRGSLHHTHLGTSGQQVNSSLTKEKMETYMLHAQMNELRHVATTQQKQIEQLVQNNIQMQQQVLEQEELKAETMLLITQLMTRVSVLELQKNENAQRDDEDGNEDEGDRDDAEDRAGY